MADEKKADYYTGPQAGDFAAAAEPFALFEAWFAEAVAHEPNDPNAFALATVDASGLPNVRMVLLKGLDAPDHPERGFVFYTNFESAKGSELLASRKAALDFHWKSLRRQVRIRGLVSVVSDAEADAYFATRPRGPPARRLGLAAIAAAGEPVRAGEGGGDGYGALSARRNSTAALLVGLPRDAGRDRVLARPSVPPARAGAVPAERCYRGLEEAAAVPLVAVTLCGALLLHNVKERVPPGHRLPSSNWPIAAAPG